MLFLKMERNPKILGGKADSGSGAQKVQGNQKIKFCTHTKKENTKRMINKC